MAKTDIIALSQGLGMGMRLLTLLTETIRAQGGDPDMILPLMTRPRFTHNLERVAVNIANLDWRIPASEMRRRTRVFFSRLGFKHEELKEASNLRWRPVLDDIGIPRVTYYFEAEIGFFTMPPTLHQRLEGRLMEYPLVVGDHVVVDLIMDETFRLGETIDPSRIEQISLAEQKYFDFNK